jgi:circadian clock protein KaiC
MASKNEKRLSTGVKGLDHVLLGGLIPGRTYVVRGGPGTGKTTLGIHFLNAGLSNNEEGLFICMGEPELKVRKDAGSIGVDLSRINILDLSPESTEFETGLSYDVFFSSEVEKEPITNRIKQTIKSIKPQRVYIDSVSQLRYLSTDIYKFRQQMLSFLQFLLKEGATVLLSSEAHDEKIDADLQFICDGIINLTYADDERTVHVTKQRESTFKKGFHSMRLTDQGMIVFPRFIPRVHKKAFVLEPVTSGIPEIDELLHGGVERGTVTVLSGPSGVGKTTLGLQFVKEAASRGEHSIVYSFEEGLDTLLNRCKTIGMSLEYLLEKRSLEIMNIEPLFYTPDEFAHLVREEVEKKRSKIVMIDSISGYKLSLSGRDLVRHLHALIKYLRNMGVTSILINEMEKITGDFMATEVGISYLMDNIVFLRYIELKGQIKKAIGVLKKRVSGFEPTMREFGITGKGIKVGKPLKNLRKILSGTPVFSEYEEPGDVEET